MVEYKQGFRRRALQCIKQKRPLLFKRSEQVATFFSLTVKQSIRPEDDAIERIQIQMIVVHVYLYNMYIY